MLVKINSNYHKALKNYGYYLKDIRNDEETGYECLEKAKALKFSKSIDEHVNDFNVMFADDTAIIVISAGNKESQGKITKTNAGITNLFRYNPLEVTGQDVNILMPPIIAAKHHQFLEKYFLTGKETVVNNERELFAMPRTGSLICISTIVKPVPNIKDDIQYIGLIRQRNKDDDFILTNVQGKIDSMSESLAGKFRFHHSFFKENEVYIQFLCPELMNLEHDKDGKLITALDSMSGFHEMTFILQKDFQTVVQGYSKNVNITRQQTISEQDNEIQSEDPMQITPAIQEVKAQDKSKTPEIVKKLAQLIHGGNYQKDLLKAGNLLKESIDYDNYDLKEKWIVEIKDLDFGEGKLKLKVFRIMTQKGHDNATSEKNYGVKSTPSKTRARPEELERLKRVGLNPDRKSNTSFENQGIIEEPKKEEQKTSIIIETKGVEEIKDNHLINLDTSQITLPENPQKQNQDLEISLTSITDQKANLSSSRNPSAVITQHNLQPIGAVQPPDPKPVVVQEDSKMMPPDAPSSQPHPADISMALNNSMAEASPLVPPETPPVYSNENPARRYPSSRDQYLRKPPHAEIQGEEQDAVIRNLLKASGDTSMEKEIAKKKPGEEDKEKAKEQKKSQVLQDDDVGSVASRARSLMKHINALRNAVYEQYCPRSVLQMKYVAQIVFIILAVITLVYFLIAQSLYADLKSNVANLYYSNDRLIYSTATGACVRALILMNGYASPDGFPIINLTAINALDYYKDGFEGNPISSVTTMNYSSWNYYGLDESAKSLKIAQNGTFYEWVFFFVR